jgi:hypothetical protein
MTDQTVEVYRQATPYTLTFSVGTNGYKLLHCLLTICVTSLRAMCLVDMLGKYLRQNSIQRYFICSIYDCGLGVEQLV